MGQTSDHIREDIEETRGRMGDTVEAIGYKTDVKSRGKENIAAKGDEVKQGARRAAGVAQQNPIGLALGSVAVGFVAGMLVPSTRVEDEKLGPMADQVKEQAKETGQEALERGKQVARETVDSAKETAGEQSGQAADDMASSLRDKAQEVGSTSSR